MYKESFRGGLGWIKFFGYACSVPPLAFLTSINPVASIPVWILLGLSEPMSYKVSAWNNKERIIKNLKKIKDNIFVHYIKNV